MTSSLIAGTLSLEIDMPISSQEIYLKEDEIMIDPLFFDTSNQDMDFLNKVWSVYPYLYGLYEIWTPVTEKSVKNIIPNRYFVSNYSRIYDSEKKAIIKNCLFNTENKYVFASFITTGKSAHRMIHRVVMLEFMYYDGCEEMQVNHKDGVKYHDWIWNLEWATCSENIQHAFDTGLKFITNRLISEDMADQIGLRLTDKSRTYQSIADELNVSLKSVCNIKSGTSFHGVYKKYKLGDIYRNPPVATDDQIHKICKFYEINKDRKNNLGFGKREEFLYEAVCYAGLDFNPSTRRIAERLFYHITHDEISNQYDY